MGELRVAPQLFAGAMCGGLIVRSTTSPVDDGSFLGAVGAVATRPDLLAHLFSIERSSDRWVDLLLWMNYSVTSSITFADP